MDILLLQALRNKKDYRALADAVPRSMFDQSTIGMLDWFKVYFSSYEDDFVDPEKLTTLMCLKAGATAEQTAIFKQFTERLKAPYDESAVQSVVSKLVELDFAGRSAAINSRYQNGEEVDVVTETMQLAKDATRRLGNGAGASWVNTDIHTLLGEMQDDSGIQWRRFRSMHENLRGLRPGDNVLLGARVDAGKSSLLAYLATDFAPQIEAMFGPDRPILWLVNEGPAKRQVPRVYQAALGCQFDELYKKSNAGVLVPEYTKAIGGRADMIRLKDAHGISIAQVRRLVADIRPAMLITDMTAHLHTNGTAGSETDRQEHIWKQLRDIACEDDLIHLGTAQISVEGKDMFYPPQSCIKDSKTGVQGTLDLQVMMGNLDNPTYGDMRGISTPKNKMPRAGKQSFVNFECVFDKGKCIFLEGGV